jgi:hypothetical protein
MKLRTEAEMDDNVLTIKISGDEELGYSHVVYAFKQILEDLFPAIPTRKEDAKH